MKNLEKANILCDYGEISIDVIKLLELEHKIILPSRYTDFIVRHNKASLNIDHFVYNDPNYSDGKGSNSIAFVDATRIQRCINNIQSDERPGDDPNWRFEDGLIPFGDNGGGDMICFDYRNNRDTNNPPIVIWNHDMGLDHRVVFIASSFEEFINMLHEP